MKVSQWFNLPYDQAELDFLDIDVRNDRRLFVDPHALRLARTPWATRAARKVGSFFTHLLELVKRDDTPAAYTTLCYLLEPNETHLGYSVAKSRGHALGPESAALVLSALLQSRAVRTGIVQDLEETALLIGGIDKDIISDMATSIIRPLLIEYTQQMCTLYGIPVQEQPAGALWEEDTLQWQLDRTTMLPVGPDGPLLFVPKIVARVTPEIQRQEFHRQVITPALQDEELAAGTELVRLAKSGAPTVRKGDVNRKHGTGKTTTIEVTQRRPELLDAYRRLRDDRMRRVPTQEQLAKALGSAAPDFVRILGRVLATPLGDAGEAVYHSGIFRFLNAVLHPNVTAPGELWSDAGFAGLRFAAIGAAAGPLSPVLDRTLASGVHVVAWNRTLDVAAARDLLAVLGERHAANELLIVAARTFTPAARAILAPYTPDLVLVDDERLAAAAAARQAGDVELVAHAIGLVA